MIPKSAVRYDAEHVPDDLRFPRTADRTNFQGRYVLPHAGIGGGTCGRMPAVDVAETVDLAETAADRAVPGEKLCS